MRLGSVVLRTTLDYGDVTELPDVPATRLQLSRNVHRYWVAGHYATGTDLLEVGCGAGQGLAHLARPGRRVVGCDYTERALLLAKAHYGERVRLVRLDAHTLPFRSSSFDTIVLLETIYYFAESKRFLSECRRVLRPRGRLIVGTVNCAWSGFLRSPYATRYFDSQALYELLTGEGFDCELLGAFPESRGAVAGARLLVRRAAGRLRLIPGTLRTRAMLKRIFYGPLLSQPRELRIDEPPSEPLVAIPHDRQDRRYSILYAVATLRSAT